MKKNHINLFLFILITLITFGLSPFVSNFYIKLAFIIFTFLTTGYFFIKNSSVFSHSLFCLIIQISIQIPYLFWPINLILPIIIYLILIITIPLIKNENHWLKKGRSDRLNVFLTLTTIIISSTALILWYKLLTPDLTDLLSFIPNDYSTVTILIFGGLGFPIVNSFIEEFIFRGILWDGFEHIITKPIIIILIQATLFGIMHFNGFPRGYIGMGLAGIYGLLLGIIRLRSSGLLIPIITHFFADLTIFLILFHIVGRI